MNSWKNAASLIILVKNASAKIGRPNFNIMMQKRSSRVKAVPNAVVFPGGVIAPSDADRAWIGHFNSFGYESSSFDRLSNANCHLTPIFKDDTSPLQRHVSLRITAIREMFEELGILICRNRDRSDRSDLWASHLRGFDIDLWQKKVHNDPEQFLALCKELDCYPDIWSLYLWNNWLTPTHKASSKYRFDTVFFMIGFESEPEAHLEKNEVAGISVTEVSDVLAAYDKKEIELVFPQWYELSRLKHQHDLESLLRFASHRSPFGTELFFPIRQKVKNGLVSILPGDELYPENPDLNATLRLCDESKTLEELSSPMKRLHRAEFYDSGEKMMRTKNYTPADHHLSPTDGNIPKVNIQSNL